MPLLAVTTRIGSRTASGTGDVAIGPVALKLVPLPAALVTLVTLVTLSTTKVPRPEPVRTAATGLSNRELGNRSRRRLLSVRAWQ